MGKATDAQVKQVREALATGGNLPDGIRINFGDPEPIQKAQADKPQAKEADKKGGQ